MSKSKGNVVTLRISLTQYGADSARLFIIFAAPPEQSLECLNSGAEGSYRFLKRLWHLAFQYQHLLIATNHALTEDLAVAIEWDKAPPELIQFRKQIHEILKQARLDYERQQFNTVALPSCMKLFNTLTKIAENYTLHEKEDPISLIHFALV